MIDIYLRNAGIVATLFFIVSIIVTIYFYVIDPALCNRRRKKQKLVKRDAIPEISLQDCIKDVESLFPPPHTIPTQRIWAEIIGTVMYKCIKNKGH